MELLPERGKVQLPSAVAVNYSIGDQLEELLLFRLDSRLTKTGLGFLDQIDRSFANQVQGPGLRDPVTDTFSRRLVQAAQVDIYQARIELRCDYQRQSDRSIQEIGTSRFAGAFRRPGDIENVIEKLEGQADPLAKLADQSGIPTGAGAPQNAGRFKQAARLEFTAFEVLVLGEFQVESSLSLAQLASGKINRGRADFGYCRRITTINQDLERSGEEAIPECRRSLSAGAGEYRRQTAPQWSTIEDIIVDQAGHMDQFNRY